MAQTNTEYFDVMRERYFARLIETLARSLFTNRVDVCMQFRLLQPVMFASSSNASAVFALLGLERLLQLMPYVTSSRWPSVSLVFARYPKVISVSVSMNRCHLLRRIGGNCS